MKRDRLDAADVLLDYAKSNGIPAPLYYENDDLFSKAIASESVIQVKFILDKLTEKYFAFEDTVRLLKLFYPSVLLKYFEITVRFVKKDRFTVEYARFEAPKALFGRNGRTPVVMCMDHHLEDWTMDSSAAKELWIRNSKHGERLSDNIEQQIKAVAKIYCVHFQAFYHVLNLE